MLLAAVLLLSQVATVVMAQPPGQTKAAKPRFTYVDDANTQFEGARFYDQAPETISNMAMAREKIPQLNGLSDASAVKVIQQAYYPGMSVEKVASKLGVFMPPPFIPINLGPIDQWRYESCQQDAATAATSQGVTVKLRICRDKFGQ